MCHTNYDMIFFFYLVHVFQVYILAAGAGYMTYDCIKKRTSPDEYLLGGQRMNAVAVGFSIMSSLMNAIFVIGKLYVFINL